MPKPTQLTISYNEHIRFSYTVDTFNQCLHVKLGRGVPEDFMKDAVCEAYDHYNSQHRDAEFIHPSAIDGTNFGEVIFDDILPEIMFVHSFTIMPKP